MVNKIICLIVIVLIAVCLFTVIYNFNHPKISNALGTIGKEEIKEHNIKFEEFYGINNYEDTKKLLKICKETYITYHEEPVKIPLVKFVTNSNEMLLEYDFERDFYTKKEETEYYICLNNILENISSNKSYKVEFKYRTHIIEGTSLIGEIDITECDEIPQKFDLKELEENRVYVEEKY